MHIKAMPWIAKLDGGAVCEYCHMVYDASKNVEQQHTPDCPWLRHHEHDRFEETAFSQARRLLCE